MTLSLPSFTCFLVRAVSLLMLLGTGLLGHLPTIRYVRTNTNPATTWATSTTNLQGIIDASSAGDQVWVATGTCKPGGNANTNREVCFATKNGLIIYRSFPAGDNPWTSATPLA